MKAKLKKALMLLAVGAPMVLFFILYLVNLCFGFGYILANWAFEKMTMKLGKMFHEINTKTNL